MFALKHHVRRIVAVGVVWTLAAGPAPGQAPVNRQTPSKADVVAALKDRERLLKSFSVSVGVELRQNSPGARYADGARNANGGAELARVGELSFLCDELRARAESKMIEGAGEEKRIAERMLVVTDGEATRQLMGSGDAWTIAAIQPSNYGLPILLDPRDYLFRVGPRNFISTMLRTATSATMKMRRQGDAQLLEIVPPSKRYIDNSREKWSVTLDVTHGFALAHFVRHRASGLNAPWTKATETTAGDFVEAAPGVWVPTVARREESRTYQTTDETGQEVSETSVQRIDVAFEDWKIHPRLDADAFVLDFPGDIEVQDDLALYNEEMRKRQPRAAAASQPLLPLLAVRSPTLVIWVNAGVTVALAAFVILRRRTKAI